MMQGSLTACIAWLVCAWMASNVSRICLIWVTQSVSVASRHCWETLFKSWDCLTISLRHLVKSVSSDEILVAISVCSSEAVVATVA